MTAKDPNFFLCREIFKRFNISVTYLAKNHNDRLEARGVFATDRLSLKQKAFPSLNHGRFQNVTYEQMLVYFLSKTKEAENFASLSDFISEYLTPEGFQLFNHLTAFIPAYARQFDAGSLADYARATANIKGNYSRPDSGLSVITGALKMSAVKLGAKLYKNQETKIIEEDQENKFKLITDSYMVSANKLVVAVPPKQMTKIKGSVAEKIRNDSTFQSVGFMVAFTGFAVFEEAWWQFNSTGSRHLADEQEMVSNSDCLGFTFPYR